MGFLLLAWGCGAGSGPPAVNSGTVRVEPSSIYFGLVPWSTTATAEIALRNDSDEDADVVALDATGDVLVIDGPASFTVPADGVVETTVRWTPATLDTLHERLAVVGPGGNYTSIPVDGVTAHAEVSAAISVDDFGSVGVGCERVSDLALSNSGDTDLIATVTTTEPTELVVRSDTGLPLAMPISVAPGSRTVVQVVYAPSTVRDIDAIIDIASNDPDAPTIQFEAHGASFSTELQAVDWHADPVEAATGIVFINPLVGHGLREQVESFVPTFTGALLATDKPFRAAIVTSLTGHVAGSAAYVDDSFTSEEAADAALRMVSGDASDDNDAGLESCLHAIEENEDWLLDSELWLDSKLNIVVINNDLEQSTSSPAYYVGRMEDIKGSAVAVHGISGPVPNGCSDNGGAPPSQSLFDAMMNTGGTFFSICASDWTDAATGLARAFVTQRFPFPSAPATESIEVSVDGMNLESGWGYDPTTNSLVFEPAAYPSEAAELHAEYVLAETCE